MLTIIIGVIAFVAIFPAFSNGEFGSVAIGAVILILLMMTSREERKDTKAYMNCRDYWADEDRSRRK